MVWLNSLYLLLTFVYRWNNVSKRKLNFCTKNPEIIRMMLLRVIVIKNPFSNYFAQHFRFSKKFLIAGNKHNRYLNVRFLDSLILIFSSVMYQQLLHINLKVWCHALGNDSLTTHDNLESDDITAHVHYAIHVNEKRHCSRCYLLFSRFERWVELS